MQEYIIDNFVNTQPGEAYRLLPFGPLYKGGKKRNITPELASTFRLPHFKPPIKLGSHDETTPAGGQIAALEVREDGLYAIPELTEQGSAAFERGDYRYHSPEVIWEDSGLEDPTTGKILSGPLIVGDALLHTPHLGEAAALYTFEPQKLGENHMTEQFTVPASLGDRFMAWLDSHLEPPKPPAEVQIPEEYTAAVAERDQYKAELENLKAQGERQALLASLTAELQNKDKFGSMYVEMSKASEAAEMLGGMTPEQRDWCMRNFSALSAQAQHPEMFTESGTSDPAPADKSGLLLQAVAAKQAELKSDFATAYEAVKVANPDLFK